METEKEKAQKERSRVSLDNINPAHIRIRKRQNKKIPFFEADSLAPILSIRAHPKVTDFTLPTLSSCFSLFHLCFTFRLNKNIFFFCFSAGRGKERFFPFNSLLIAQKCVVRLQLQFSEVSRLHTFPILLVLTKCHFLRRKTS